MPPSPSAKHFKRFLRLAPLMLLSAAALKPVSTAAQSPAAPKADTAFAANLLHQLASKPDKPNQNLLVSPYSITTALMMVERGARGGDTRNAISGPMTNSLIDAHISSHDTVLQNRADRWKALMQAVNVPSTDFVLTSANAVWVSNATPVLPEFSRTLLQDFGAPAQTLDFAASGGASAARTINTWTERQTLSRIKDLVSAWQVKESKLILTNAVYFKAKWATPFVAARTQPMPFRPAQGAELTVPTMQSQQYHFYGETQQAQVLALPYSGGQVSAHFYLPKKGVTLAQLLAPKAMNAAFSAPLTTQNEVIVKLPKFRFESQFELKDPLIKLGMGVAFSPQADFSGITGKKDVMIGQVIHKTFVELDEAGTEAAAATALMMAAASAGPQKAKPQPKQFIANHPFAFAIRHDATGVVLFMGVVNLPASAGKR